MRLYKRYVEVIVLTSKEGKLKPLYLIWDGEEGKESFRIDKIYNIRKAASQVGGCGLLYECWIDGKDRFLFYERDRWFIESYKP